MSEPSKDISRQNFLRLNWAKKSPLEQKVPEGDIVKPNIGESKIFRQITTRGEELSIEEEVFLVPPKKSEVDFVGGTHNIYEFYYWRNLIEDRVKKSDFVICEYVPFEETWKLSDPLKKELTSGEGSNFKTTSAYYEQITELAKTYNKPVACVDPHNFYFSMYLSLPEAMKAVLPGVLAVEKGVKLLNKNIKKPISRREFLAWATISGFGFYLDYTTSLPTLLAKSLVQTEDQLHEQLTTYGFDDQFIFDAANYRNIAMSENIKKLAIKYDGNKFAMFCGRAHRGAVKEYVTVDHSIEKAIKKLPSKVLDLIGDNSVRVYDWNKESKDWTKREN